MRHILIRRAVLTVGLLASCQASDDGSVAETSTSASTAAATSGPATMGTTSSEEAGTTGSSSSSTAASSEESSSGSSSTGIEVATDPPPVDCGDVVHDGELVVTDASDPAETMVITHVTGSVRVVDTEALADLSGLSGLLCVDQALEIASNAALLSIDGLENLRSVRGVVELSGNPVLSQADAMQSLSDTGGLRIGGNPSLSAFPRLADGLWFRHPAEVTMGGNGFEDLGPLTEVENITVAGRLYISIGADAVLRSTFGIGALGAGSGVIDLSVGGDEANPSVLEEIDLTGFEEIRTLALESWFPDVHTLFAPDLVRVDRLRIYGLNALTDLNGFSALEEVTTSVILGCGGSGPGGFTSLDGLEALTVAPQLIITDAPELVSIDALSTSLGTDALWIKDNPMLPGADADAYADAVDNDAPVVCGNLGQAACDGYDCFSFD